MKSERADVRQDLSLGVIFAIAKTLVSETDVDRMLSVLLSSLIDTLDAAETGLLEIYDPVRERLQVVHAVGFDVEPLSLIQLSPGEAMGGTALQTGRTEIYTTAKAIERAHQNLAPENRALLERATLGLQPSLSAICIPLIAGQVKIGALVLENQSLPDQFTQDDVPFLETVADLIALAIENARLRQELHETRAMEEANRFKAELISTLAHEMRTPLTSIKGYSTALLMEGVQFDPQAQQQFLEIIDQECDVLQDLIHDLLESSVIDAGLLQLEPQPVRLARLAHNVVDDLGHRTQSCRFMVDFVPGFPIVDADPRRIEQVLRNLLDNAIKYSPQGGLIVVQGEASGSHVTVSVADQGVGIAPEDLNRLFEKFFRARSGLARHVVGSGLGLPIARTIVESHGGQIWAESRVGQGSTFYFTLPVCSPLTAQDLTGGRDG
jgi:signal transduction histidine kinase